MYFFYFLMNKFCFPLNMFYDARKLKFGLVLNNMLLEFMQILCAKYSNGFFPSTDQPKNIFQISRKKNNIDFHIIFG